MQKLRWLIYKAWHYYRQGEPLPLDIYSALYDEGIVPDSVIEAFDEGFKPNDFILFHIRRQWPDQEDESPGCGSCGFCDFFGGQ